MPDPRTGGENEGDGTVTSPFSEATRSPRRALLGLYETAVTLITVIVSADPDCSPLCQSQRSVGRCTVRAATHHVSIT